jgi:hypothetical protein
MCFSMKLWLVAEKVLLLSRGQASVERGFSVNKQAEVDNHIGSIFEAKCMLCDHIAALGGVCNIDVDNKLLLLSCSSARQKYGLYLVKQKGVLRML